MSERARRKGGRWRTKDWSAWGTREWLREVAGSGSTAGGLGRADWAHKLLVPRYGPVDSCETQTAVSIKCTGANSCPNRGMKWISSVTGVTMTTLSKCATLIQ